MTTPQQKREFTKMILTGSTAKVAAAAVGISENSACQWRKNLPALRYAAQRKAIQKKIDAELSGAADPSTLMRLTGAAAKLEKCIAATLETLI